MSKWDQVNAVSSVAKPFDNEVLIGELIRVTHLTRTSAGALHAAVGP